MRYRNFGLVSIFTLLKFPSFIAKAVQSKRTVLRGKGFTDHDGYDDGCTACESLYTNNALELDPISTHDLALKAMKWSRLNIVRVYAAIVRTTTLVDRVWSHILRAYTENGADTLRV